MSIFKVIVCQFVLAPMLAQASSATLKITPLPDDEFLGPSCALLTPKGKVLTDGVQIIIDGRGLRMGKPTYGKGVKTWLINGYEITYSTKGKLLEDLGGFAPGRGKVGLLTIKLGVEKSETPAQEVCLSDV
jgi:hypothetical protein